MRILVTYDVQTESNAGQKRLRKVSKLCMNYGQRVQNSVFECSLTEVQLTELKHKLDQSIDGAKDSIRIYHIGRFDKTETLGKVTAYDVEDTLII